MQAGIFLHFDYVEITMHNLRTASKATLLILLAGMMAACNTIQNAIVEPNVHVKSVQYHAVSLNEGQLDAHLQLSNPNSFALPLRNMTYSLKLNERVFANSQLAFDKDLPAKGMLELDVPIRFQYGELLHGLASVITRQDVKFQLEGRLDLGLISIPFSKTGEFALVP